MVQYLKIRRYINIISYFNFKLKKYKMYKQTKITDYFHSEKTENLKEMNEINNLLYNECVRIREECKTMFYSAQGFMIDMGTLTEYVLALGDKINSMK